MICIAEHRGYKDGEHTLELTDKVVDQDEFDTFYANFKVYSHYHQFKEIYEICLESNLDLRKFLLTENLNELLRNKNIKSEKILQTGNKLLSNYCTVIKIMVEKIESYLKHNQPDKLEEFRGLCSKYYDSDFSYRFFMRLRNYIVHNEMPFKKIKRALYEDCNLYILRDSLLKWSGWSIVRKDLEEMENNDIAIQPYLLEIGAAIYGIYLQGLYYLAPLVVESIHNVEAFMEKYHVQRFDFIEYESEEELRKGQYQFHIVPTNDLIRCAEELNRHPRINIRIGEEKE